MLDWSILYVASICTLVRVDVASLFKTPMKIFIRLFSLSSSIASTPMKIELNLATSRSRMKIVL